MTETRRISRPPASWFERAAASGEAPAMTNLGLLARDADPPDLEAAREWFERAAASGEAGVVYTLAALAR